MDSQREKLTCPRCGLLTIETSEYCPACGFHFNLQGDRQHRSNAARAHKGSANLRSDRKGTFLRFENDTSEILSKPQTKAAQIIENGQFLEDPLFSLFGWRKLTGVVIAIDPSYMVKAESSLIMMAIKAVIIFLLFPVILGVALGVQIAAVMLSSMNIFHGKSSGFFGNLLSQLIGFVIMGKLLGPKEQIAVRDVRLKESDGREWLVRIRGELLAGNLNVGDDVTVEGFDRHGTLMFRRGSNIRTGAKIIAKYR